MHYLLSELIHQQMCQLKMAKVVCSNLHLKAILGVALRTSHHTSIKEEEVYGRLRAELFGQPMHTAQVCQIQLRYFYVALQQKQQA